MANHATACLKARIRLEFWKPNQIRILSKSVSSHGDFPEVCTDPNKDQGLLSQLQGKTENSKQEGYLVLMNQSAVTLCNKAVDF